MLIFPRLDECRRLAGAGSAATAAEVLQAPAVRAFFQRWSTPVRAQGTGSANRVARALVLADPPSIDRGEITDKGSINQRAVLKHRAALVDALYQRAGAEPAILHAANVGAAMSKTVLLIACMIQFGDCDPAGIVFYPELPALDGRGVAARSSCSAACRRGASW